MGFPESGSTGCGWFQSVYGTAVFAKVTEQTLPGFPWKSVDAINDAVTDIYRAVSESFGLESLASDDLNNPEGVFYQFEDGLYFRAAYEGRAVRELNGDYSSMQILQNTPNEVEVKMDEADADNTTGFAQRGIVKNDENTWVLTDIEWE